METAAKLYDREETLQPVLRKVDLVMQHEDEQLNQIYTAMGWDDLPYRLKFLIAPDIVGYFDELTDRYSTSDPFVLARRQRVLYWIDTFRNGHCSLDTIMNALRIEE